LTSLPITLAEDDKEAEEGIGKTFSLKLGQQSVNLVNILSDLSMAESICYPSRAPAEFRFENDRISSKRELLAGKASPVNGSNYSQLINFKNAYVGHYCQFPILVEPREVGMYAWSSYTGISGGMISGERRKSTQSTVKVTLEIALGQNEGFVQSVILSQGINRGFYLF